MTCGFRSSYFSRLDRASKRWVAKRSVLVFTSHSALLVRIIAFKNVRQMARQTDSQTDKQRDSRIREKIASKANACYLRFIDSQFRFNASILLAFSSCRAQTSGSHSPGITFQLLTTVHIGVSKLTTRASPGRVSAAAAAPSATTTTTQR